MASAATATRNLKRQPKMVANSEDDGKTQNRPPALGNGEENHRQDNQQELQSSSSLVEIELGTATEVQKGPPKPSFSIEDLQPPRSNGERFRDSMLRMLDHPIAQIMGVIVIILVIISGAIFFFMLVGLQSQCRPRTNCSPRNEMYNASIQALNILFTYMATVSMPWRCTNFIHIVGFSCPFREHQPGHDLYGFPTDEIWFHIPLRARLGITLVLLTNCLTQYANQATRIRYYNFELQNEFPGNVWTNVFFVTSFACAGIGGAWMAYEMGQLRKQSPGTFGPGPIDLAMDMYKQYVEKNNNNNNNNNNKENNTNSANNIDTSTSTSNKEDALARGNVDEEEAAHHVETSDDGAKSQSEIHYPDPTRDVHRRSILGTQQRSSMRMFGM